MDHSSALELVNENVDVDHPLIIRRQLAQQVEKLLREHMSKDLIREALREWDAMPDAGPPLLPHLVSKVVRCRNIQQRMAEAVAAQFDWEDKLKQEMNG